MKTKLTLLTALKTACLFVALLQLSANLFALVPGDTIPSQKLNYIDPVSGKKCARLTTMGMANHTTIYCGQDSAGESYQWSADSKSVILWFSVPGYPKGIYLMNVETGLIRYLAPVIGAGNFFFNHATFNPRDPNEVIYHYGSINPRFVEIRGVKTTPPYTVRTIKRFNGVSQAGGTLSLSHDGKYCYVMLYSPNPYGVVFNMLTGADHPYFPFRGAGWKYGDKSALQDGCLWNPKNNKAIVKQVPVGAPSGTTLRKNVCFDFDNPSATITHTCPTSHATWSPDGTMTVSPFGIISVDNRCLGKDGISGKNAHYYMPPHPFANPAEAALGDNGHVVGEDYNHFGPRYIHYVTWKELKTTPWVTILTRTQNRIGLWWGDHSANSSHPHMQMSPNGKYMVWVSNLRSRMGGTDTLPPGPKNPNGNASYADVFMMEVNAGAVVGPVAPAAPSALTATVGSSTQINLTWSDNANNETGYKIERKTGSGGTYAQIANVGADVASFSNTGLAANTQYTYRVRATNSVGNSSYSNEANATTTGNVPAAPTGLTAAAISSTQINLSWTDNSNNETGFKIERKTGANSYAQIATVGVGVKTFKNTGLKAKTPYTYRVRATNRSGDSAYTNEAKTTTLSAAPVISSSANASSPVNDNFSYQIVASGTPTSYGATGLPAGLSVDSGSGLISGVPSVAGVYSVTVSATGSGGTASAALNLTIQTVPMAAPVNLTAVVAGSAVNLSWSDNSSDETSFRVWRKEGTVGTWGLIATVKESSAFEDTNVLHGKNYTYRVRARKGETADYVLSSWSNDFSVTFP